MSAPVKVKIIKITYDKENNLFQLLVNNLDLNKQAILAIKGTDWGILPDYPEDVIEQFCKDMTGKEKNLHIEVDETSIKDVKKDEEGEMIQEDMNKINVDYFIHIGIFIFESKYLLEEYKTGKSHIQEIEDLEWLKILDQNYKIYALHTKFHEVGVDTREDYEYLKDKYENK